MELKELKKLSKKELKERLEDLEQVAEDNFIEQSKFCVFDYLDDSGREEFERIQFLLGESDYNPDEE